jgi:hypothetical protein
MGMQLTSILAKPRQLYLIRLAGGQPVRQKLGVT